MKKTIFILCMLWAGMVSAQIGSNPSNFNNGLALPNATNEGDTLSVDTKFPIMDNAGKINYFANIGDIDGLFTGAVWGAITGTLSDQTDLQTQLDSKLSRNINETTAGSLTFESGSDNLKVQFNGVIFNRGLSYLNATVNTQSLRIGGLTGTNWNEIQLNSENGVVANSTVSGDDPVNADDFVTKGYGESNFATVESGTWTPTIIGATVSSYSNQEGRYTIIGDVVNFYITIGATFSSSGNLTISLPDFDPVQNATIVNVKVSAASGMTNYKSIWGVVYVGSPADVQVEYIPEGSYVPSIYSTGTPTSFTVSVSGSYITSD